MSIDKSIMTNFQKPDAKDIEIMQYIAKVLMELITSDEDTLDLRTEVNEPKELALLKEWSKYAREEWISNVKDESEKMKEDKLSGLIKRFYTNYERLMFSIDRKSREEIVKVLTAFFYKEKENLQNNSNDISNLIHK